MARKTDWAISFTILCMAGQAFAAAPRRMELDPNSSEVRFTAMGKPSLLRIKGEGAHATGAFEEAGADMRGSISVALDDFHTGITLRDKHMKEKYLELGKPEYARAELKVATLDAACVGAAAGEAKPCPFTGTLTLHGKTQPVTGTASVGEEGAGRRLKAEWTIRLSDYGIDVPTFAGVTVADEVKISAEARGTLTGGAK